jgi:hypothetical protein
MTRRNPTTLRPGDDVHRAVGELYRYGRTYPDKPPHDYEPRQGKPGYTTPVPTRDEEYAHYGQATRDERITPAFDEQATQFPDDKHGAKYDNDASGWVRGKGSPHPFFDRGGSGSRYSRRK